MRREYVTTIESEREREESTLVRLRESEKRVR